MATTGGYEPGQFCWVDLAAKDRSAAAAFYEGLFGWTTEDQDTGGGPQYAIFRLDGDEVAGIGELDDAMKAQGVPPTWSSYIWVANADEAVERIQAHGGIVTVPVIVLLTSIVLSFGMRSSLKISTSTTEKLAYS